MRFRSREREKRGADKCGNLIAVLFGMCDQIKGESLLSQSGDIIGSDRGDSDTGNFIFPDRDPESQIGREDKLPSGVVPLYICGGVGLGITEMLRLPKSFFIIYPFLLNLVD